MITKEQAQALEGHTPGPWEVGQDTCSLSGKLSVHTSDNYYVALIDHSNVEDANARLIAAAPDLLATIIALHERVERLTVKIAVIVERDAMASELFASDEDRADNFADTARDIIKETTK